MSNPTRRRHVLDLDDVDAGEISAILETARSMQEVLGRLIKQVPALRGRTVVNMFFEDSTRTRLSFETAAKRLSADTMTFSVSTSSVNKGESLRDTVETISDMGIDAFVVRHKSTGIPWQISEWTGDLRSVVELVDGDRDGVLDGGGGQGLDQGA